MFEYLQNIFGSLVTAIGTVVLAGGGLSALAYGLFRFFGERWLNVKFEERLVEYKHAQQKELGHLRLEINSLLDRNIKLHQKEFDVLPQAWSLFNDAFWQISEIWGLKTYPDLNTFSSEKLEEFLNERPLTGSQKNEIRAADDKTRLYMRIAEWAEIRDALKSYSEWKSFFLKNGIFMPEPVKAVFGELDELIKGALVEHKLRVENQGIKYSEMKDFNKLLLEGRKLRGQLEADIQKRLWISATFHPPL